MNCIYSLKAIMNLTTIDPHDNLTRKFGFSKDYFALKKDAQKECSSKRTINFLKFDFLNMFFIKPSITLVICAGISLAH